MSATGSGKSYPDAFQAVLKNSRALASAQPDVMRSFVALHMATAAPRALDTKTKELMALAISVVVRCDDCIAYHIHDAVEAGATREEMAEAIGVGVLMGGGPGMIYGSHAIEAVDQFLARTEQESSTA